MKQLSQSFFVRPTLTVAEELLGKVLVRQYRRRVIAGVITDTEAYIGQKDKASHGRFGKTARTAPMFGPAGHWYVYFVYGMYWMLNVVTEEEGRPAAVLIRAVCPVRAPHDGRGAPRRRGVTYDGVEGPGRLTGHFKINQRFTGKPVRKETRLWIENRDIIVLKQVIKRGPRVGIHYAGSHWAGKKWRFWIECENIDFHNA